MSENPSTLFLLGKTIDLSRSPILYQSDFSTADAWTGWFIASGTWTIADGWLTGSCPAESGGMIFLDRRFPDDLVLEFEGRTVPPCDHDLNFVWRSAGWDRERDDAAAAYIGSLNGWWDGKLGIERYPEGGLNAMSGLFTSQAGQTYQVLAGAIGGHCFLQVDGCLALEMTDPDPLQGPGQALVGLGCFAGSAAFRRLRVRQARWEVRAQRYSG